MYRVTYIFEFIALGLLLSGHFLEGIILGFIATTVGYLLWRNEHY